jgi:hypothetical protein
MHGCTLSFVGTCTSIKTVQLDYFYGPKSNINVLTNETDFNHVYLYGDDGYFGDIKVNK